MDNHQQASIAQMMEITNCGEDVAVNYLTRTNYDVEIAIRHFFEGTVPESIRQEPVSSQSSSQSTSPTPENIPASSRSGAVLPRYHTLLQIVAQLMTFPVRLPLILINFVYDFFFGPRQVASPHIFDYISTYYPQFESKMSDIFYGQHLQNLRSDLQANDWKWLIAYIHDPRGNPTFFESLFVSNFSEKIRSRQGVFFGCVVGSEDAVRLRPDRAFGRARKSCVILYVIRGTSLTRKLLIDQLADPETVDINIDLALADLIAEEAERESQERARNETRQLMEEQNREYQESLQKDLERIAKAKQEEESAKKALEEERKKREETESRVKKVESYKRQLVEKDNVHEGAHDLLIRFANGKKIIKFDEDDKVEKIFDEALKSDNCPLFFQMHQSFPKKAVPCLPQWYYDILMLEGLEPKEECLSRNLTFKEAEITRGSLVYIDNL